MFIVDDIVLIHRLLFYDLLHKQLCTAVVILWHDVTVITKTGRRSVLRVLITLSRFILCITVQKYPLHKPLEGDTTPLCFTYAADHYNFDFWNISVTFVSYASNFSTVLSFKSGSWSKPIENRWAKSGKITMMVKNYCKKKIMPPAYLPSRCELFTYSLTKTNPLENREQKRSCIQQDITFRL